MNNSPCRFCCSCRRRRSSVFILNHFFFFLLGDVFERLANMTTYTEKTARDLAVQLIKAMEVMHDRKIAHRGKKTKRRGLEFSCVMATRKKKFTSIHISHVMSRCHMDDERTDINCIVSCNDCAFFFFFFFLPFQTSTRFKARKSSVTQ